MECFWFLFFFFFSNPVGFVLCAGNPFVLYAAKVLQIVHVVSTSVTGSFFFFPFNFQLLLFQAAKMEVVFQHNTVF